MIQMQNLFPMPDIFGIFNTDGNMHDIIKRREKRTNTWQSRWEYLAILFQVYHKIPLKDKIQINYRKQHIIVWKIKSDDNLF